MNIDAIKKMVAESVAEGIARGTRKFLVDHREMLPDLPITELYYLLPEMENIGATRQQSVAIIWRPGPEQHDVMAFYRDRAQNAGFTHRLFIDEQSALAWLAEVES
jgi:hypothetical protein